MMPRYYHPSQMLVDYFEKELQSLQPNPGLDSAGGGAKRSFIRSKDRRSVAKNKNDAIERIYQAFADVTYFLEFIEDHQELHELYEKDLKDLFGFDLDSDTARFHKQNRGGPFERLIRAALLTDSPATKNLDYRTHLLGILVVYAIGAMRSRIVNDNEQKIMHSDLDRVWLWNNLLLSRIRDEQASARRRIGFYPYQYDPTHDQMSQGGGLLPEIRVNERGQKVKECSKCHSWVPIMNSKKRS